VAALAALSLLSSPCAAQYGPPKVKFSTGTYACSESMGKVTIIIELTESCDSDVVVKFKTAAGTAKPGKDYVDATAEVTIPAHREQER